MKKRISRCHEYHSTNHQHNSSIYKCISLNLRVSTVPPQGVHFGFNRNALVIHNVPVENVQLDVLHRMNDLLQDIQWEEVARRINQQATMLLTFDPTVNPYLESRGIFNRNGGIFDFILQVFKVEADQLGQCLEHGGTSHFH